MGLFGKIKNILFEDEDEVEEMPVYTKEEVKESTKRVEVEEPAPVVEEPIKTSDNSYFTNVKRDIDLSYDERDVLGDVTEKKREVVEAPREVKEEVYLSTPKNRSNNSMLRVLINKEDQVLPLLNKDLEIYVKGKLVNIVVKP